MDALSTWGKEFASALASFAPTIGWIPQLSWTGVLERWERDCNVADPPLQAKRFPVQRGYRRWPIGAIARTAARQNALLRSASAGHRSPVLIVTSPYYAPLAALWQGPVIYYVTDLLPKYAGFREAQVRGLDEQLCRVASLVCPNSARVAAYLSDTTKGLSSKMVIVPNATREQNLLPRVAYEPSVLPREISDLPRPIAGVIGNLAGNMDWELLERVVHGAPFLSWVFVGPTAMPAGSAEQNRARSRLVDMGGRVRFTGEKPYGALRDYARAFDVAVLPYRKHEPTYSGSSTRFYEHLAACRPIVATTGFAELMEKEPLLQLASGSEEMLGYLSRLRAAGFRDGYEALRWETSLGQTWQARALFMMEALAERTSGLTKSGTSTCH